ncbi:MAG: hypothetical protein WA945_07745 [Arcobacteraceae bacterium]
MIGTILRIVAISGAGYAAGKLVHDDEFRRELKDKITSLFYDDEPKDTIEEDTPNDETKQIPYIKQ